MILTEEPTQAIRIEHHEDGYGIFRSQNAKKENRWSVLEDVYLRELRDRHEYFPTPAEEGRWINQEEFCGFKSLDQIYEWFTSDEIQYIISKGFKVFLIKITKCYLGEYQIVFKKENIISKEEITNLFL